MLSWQGDEPSGAKELVAAGMGEWYSRRWCWKDWKQFAIQIQTCAVDMVPIQLNESAVLGKRAQCGTRSIALPLSGCSVYTVTMDFVRIECAYTSLSPRFENQDERWYLQGCYARRPPIRFRNGYLRTRSSCHGQHHFRIQNTLTHGIFPTSLHGVA